MPSDDAEPFDAFLHGRWNAQEGSKTALATIDRQCAPLLNSGRCLGWTMQYLMNYGFHSTIFVRVADIRR